MTKVNRDLEKNLEESKKLQEKRLKILQRFLITCKECNKTNRASRWEFLQNKRWYCPPSWQSGGFFVNDEWSVCHAICPSCKQEIYIYNHKGLFSLIKHIQKSMVSPKDVFGKTDVGYVEGTDRVIAAVQSGKLVVRP